MENKFAVGNTLEFQPKEFIDFKKFYEEHKLERFMDEAIAKNKDYIDTEFKASLEYFPYVTEKYFPVIKEKKSLFDEGKLMCPLSILSVYNEEDLEEIDEEFHTFRLHESKREDLAHYLAFHKCELVAWIFYDVLVRTFPNKKFHLVRQFGHSFIIDENFDIYSPDWSYQNIDFEGEKIKVTVQT